MNRPAPCDPAADAEWSAASRLEAAVALATRHLAAAGMPDPRRDAELLLSGILGIPRLELYRHAHEHLAPEIVAAMAANVARRQRHEPVQYILGTAAFHQLELRVGLGTLVPRPETETIVELLLKLAPPHAAVLDLGTGSGNIALAIAQARPDLRVTGIDLSPEALAWALDNRHRLGLDAQVEMLPGDLFTPVTGRRFDIIAANLPYVRADEWPNLPDEIRQWEPVTALVAGHDGLDTIRRAVAAAPDHLAPDGIVLLEVSPPQIATVMALGAQQGFAHCRCHADLAGRMRFVQLQSPATPS